MNEVTTYQETKALPSVYSDPVLYGEFYKMAEALSKTALVPANYQNKPENCLIAMDMARQIGCKSPIFVMQNLYVVNGKPSWSGQYCAAVIRSSFTNVEIHWDKSKGFDNCSCRIVATDKNGNICIGTKITIDMAKKEGWYGKSGSKWQTMPEQMLQYRAFSFFARTHCPEKLLGLHDEYEVSDIEPGRSENINKLEEKLSGEIIDADYEISPDMEEQAEEFYETADESSQSARAGG